MYRLNPESLKAIITIDDRKDTRTVYNDIIDFWEKHNIRLYVVKNRNQFREAIYNLKPELCIVVCWYWLIGKEVLSFVPKGFIGIHHSLLPKYRGSSPLVWQMINGEKEVGTSIFSFTEDMDAGDIWHQEIVKITAKDYIKDALDKLENKVLNWFRKNYLNILNDKIQPFPQEHSQATYCAQRFPFDGQIDWNKSSTEIYNYIRAQSEPYPGAFTHFNGKKLTIWRARPLDVTYYGEAGQVARVSKEGVYVICGDQKPIILETVQLENDEEKPANNVIKSFKTRFQTGRGS